MLRAFSAPILLFQLNTSLQRAPIELQIRALQNKKQDLESKLDALLDEARKKGVQPGDLR